jgi:hypothetical protein
VTVCPAASSGPTAGSQHHAPPNAPWTSTNRAMARPYPASVTQSCVSVSQNASPAYSR